MEVREQIRSFVAKELNRRPSSGADTFSDSDSLLLSKKTDSLFFIDLIVFLETNFSLQLNSSEIEKDDLDSVDKMVALIESQR